MEEQKVLCNKCGRQLDSVNGILREDGLFVRKDWGYFSKKDLQIHSFTICESCYDEWIDGFVIPVDVDEKSSALD